MPETTTEPGNTTGRLSWEELQDATPEQVEAHNQAVEEQLDDRLDELQAAEQEAVDALRSYAQDTLQTETVTLPNNGPTLDVLTRIPTRVENLQDRFQALKANGDLGQARELAARMMAGMVVSDGYDSPRVWLQACQLDDAGLQWLMECADVVLAPAKRNMEAVQGNSTPGT